MREAVIVSTARFSFSSAHLFDEAGTCVRVTDTPSPAFEISTCPASFFT